MPARAAISLAVGRGSPPRTSSRTAVTTAARVRADRAVRPSTVWVTPRTVEVLSLRVQRRRPERRLAAVFASRRGLARLSSVALVVVGALVGLGACGGSDSSDPQTLNLDAGRQKLAQVYGQQY